PRPLAQRAAARSPPRRAHLRHHPAAPARPHRPPPPRERRGPRQQPRVPRPAPPHARRAARLPRDRPRPRLQRAHRPLPPLGALQLPPSAYAPARRAHALPTGEDYDRYVWLAALLRDAGYRPGYLRDAHPFAVEDPLVNATYLASSHALAEISEIVGADPAPHRERARRVHHALLDRLWDPEHGCFRARDLRDGRLLPVVTIGAFGPLLDPDLPAAVVRNLVDLLLS